MANFISHLEQAKRNLKFLEDLCINFKSDYWDWKVTSCYYIAVHLVNAHIADKENLHYQTHGQVNQAINPFNTSSKSSLQPDVYYAYEKLNILSRRSRYLVNRESTDNNKQRGYLTFDKHFKKAIKQLEIILRFFDCEHNIKFNTTKIHCLELRGERLNYFLLEAQTI
jgi:hypothetical protein